ncbi:MAG: hypothetical protein OHK0046_48580 [Anaerolineae bacterium]
MNDLWKHSLWQQFGAAIDYLADAVNACPDTLWRTALWKTPDYPPDHPPERPPELGQFWYVTYHTLFWLDLYLTGTEEGFVPPPPFTLIEQSDDGPLPERVYTKGELLAYLDDCRQKCYRTIKALTAESAERLCQFGWGECSFLELLLYNMRHVHGHASQLEMLLGQTLGPQPDYVTQVRTTPDDDPV